MKSIVLFVEGDGDVDAVPILVKRLLTELNAWSTVRLDKDPFRVGELSKLIKNDWAEWKKYLAACMKRKNVGAVLLLLDGDVKKIAGKAFCAVTVAKQLAQESAIQASGVTFSVAVVIALKEFESW